MPHPKKARGWPYQHRPFPLSPLPKQKLFPLETVFVKGKTDGGRVNAVKSLSIWLEVQ